jgi:hypothetical protein
MKKLLSILLCLIAAATLAIPAAADESALPVLISEKPGYTFTDLDADWYRDAAITFGYPEIFGESELFLPRKTITRMEFVRLLHRALGITINYFAATDIAEHFDDVVNVDPGASQLYDLVTAGIVTPGGDFNPDAPLTREVMVHWAIKALDYVTGGDYAIILIMPAPFEDDAEIAEEYKNDIIKAVILGLIKGRGNNMLFPKDSATRAEAVTVVDRLANLIDSLTQQGVDVSASARETDGAIEMTLTITNNTGETVTIEHTSGQKYDFQIFDAEGEILYTWSADKSFIQVLGTTEIAEGESLTFTETLGADEYTAIKDKAVELRAYIVGTADFIDQNGYSVPLDANGYSVPLN